MDDITNKIMYLACGDDSDEGGCCGGGCGSNDDDEGGCCGGCGED